ncbi:MAG: hypothetical protein KA134_04910, partial [Achromobacter sp.]|nr:hypothetical protein [Achromobacter sp.]
QMEAVFAQIDANQRDGAHERSPKKNNPHSAYRFVGIGLTISLAPGNPGGISHQDRREAEPQRGPAGVQPFSG